VLFFTVQAASNDDAGDDGGSTPLLAGSSVSATDTNPALSRAENVEEGSRSAADIFPHPEYAFSPRPSPSSEDGTFRILVADDVRILRKGLVHTVSEVFRDVPVSVATACTAEEVLRALADDPYDLVVCDNQFLHEPLSLPALAVVDGREERRPRLLHDPTTVSAWSPSSATPASHGAPPGEVAALHRRAKDFFEAERFSLREGDGALSGYDALRRVAPASASAYVGLSSESITGWIEAEPLALPYPAPILVLLSGQRFGAPPRDGVIVAQKPLAKSAFVALLEEHAADLLRSGYCMEASGAGEEHGNSGGCIVNRHGSQLFVSREPGAAASSASRLQ
jgi:CheY-like chemotaxis protein